MEKEKDFKKILKLAIKNLLMLLFIVGFVVVFTAIFGAENQLLGVGLITGLIVFYQIDMGLDSKQAPIIIFILCILMAFANLVNYYNIYLGIIANIIVISVFMTLSTVHLMYKTYIPFVLMHIFAEAMPLQEGQLFKRFLAFFVSGVLLSLIYHMKHKNLKNGKTIKQIIDNIYISRETTVFNLKMMIGLSIAMFLSLLFKIEKGMWISMTVMSLTQPHFHITKERIKYRFLGTIIGFCAFLLIFEGFIPDKYLGIITAILAYAYTFMKHYFIQIIFVTINSLNAADGVFDTSYHSGIYRLYFVFLGMVIVLIVIMFEKMLDKKVTLYPDDEEQLLTNDDNV